MRRAWQSDSANRETIAHPASAKLKFRSSHGSRVRPPARRACALVSSARCNASMAISGLAADKYGNGCLRKNLLRFAAEKCRGEACPTVRRHHDQIASLFLCSVENCPPWYVVLDVQCLAWHAGRTCLALDARELVSNDLRHLFLDASR